MSVSRTGSALKLSLLLSGGIQQSWNFDKSLDTSNTKFHEKRFYIFEWCHMHKDRRM